MDLLWLLLFSSVVGGVLRCLVEVYLPGGGE